MRNDTSLLEIPLPLIDDTGDTVSVWAHTDTHGVHITDNGWTLHTLTTLNATPNPHDLDRIMRRYDALTINGCIIMHAPTHANLIETLRRCIQCLSALMHHPTIIGPLS